MGRGAMAMFLNDAQTDADITKFANANIDDILNTRTSVVKHDAATADPDANMFSEAVFVANADDADINVDDENFWEAIGVGMEEEKDETYSSPFARGRRGGMRTRQSKSQSLDFYSDMDDEMYDEDLGVSLLGALSYIIYGQWTSIFGDLSAEAKQHFGLTKDDEATAANSDDETSEAVKTNEANTNSNENAERKEEEDEKKKEEPALQQWQID